MPQIYDITIELYKQRFMSDFSLLLETGSDNWYKGQKEDAVLKDSARKQSEKIICVHVIIYILVV